MDAACAASWAVKIQIGKDQLVREEYEILILKEIYESEFGALLVLKNGAALRLAYHSARFAENLDFNLVGQLEEKKFLSFLKKLNRHYPALKFTKLEKGYRTLVFKFKIDSDLLYHPVFLKLEVHQQIRGWVKGQDYDDRIVTSELVPLTVLAQVASLDQIAAEKETSLKGKKSARDAYDCWFVNQLLQKGTNMDFSGFDKAQVKNELHKFLAKPYWPLINAWLG